MLLVFGGYINLWFGTLVRHSKLATMTNYGYQTSLTKTRPVKPVKVTLGLCFYVCVRERERERDGKVWLASKHRNNITIPHRTKHDLLSDSAILRRTSEALTAGSRSQASTTISHRYQKTGWRGTDPATVDDGGFTEFRRGRGANAAAKI